MLLGHLFGYCKSDARPVFPCGEIGSEDALAQRIRDTRAAVRDPQVPGLPIFTSRERDAYGSPRRGMLNGIGDERHEHLLEMPGVDPGLVGRRARIGLDGQTFGARSRPQRLDAGLQPGAQGRRSQ